MSNYCVSCVYGIKHVECDGEIQDAYVVGRTENNAVSREEYAKALNKALLENNDNLDDSNIMGIDAMLAPPKGSKERKRLEKLFIKLRKERNSPCPYFSEIYVHFESARGIDWE